jgi:hypothetical protein
MLLSNAKEKKYEGISVTIYNRPCQRRLVAGDNLRYKRGNNKK